MQQIDVFMKELLVNEGIGEVSETRLVEDESTLVSVGVLFIRYPRPVIVVYPFCWLIYYHSALRGLYLSQIE